MLERREERRVAHVGEHEFWFFECWETDPHNQHNPQATVRHWFRAPNGIEASSADELLQRLSGKAVVPWIDPPPTTEWDRKLVQTVRVRDEDVAIEICEHYTLESDSPASVTIQGPHGLETSTYAEMLELLGVPPPQQPSAIGDQLSETNTGGNSQPALSISHNGTLVADSSSLAQASGTTHLERPLSKLESNFESHHAFAERARREREQELNRYVEILKAAEAAEQKSAVTPTKEGREADAELQKSSRERSTGDNAREDLSSDLGDPTLNVSETLDITLMGEAFEKLHPWLWGPEEDVPMKEPFVSMQTVWLGEYTKAVDPELHAAALDPKKYQEYMERNDCEMPVPLPEHWDEDAKSVAAESPRCQFIKADGEQCGSPALKRKRLCHFHSKTAEPRKRKSRKSTGEAIAQDEVTAKRGEKRPVALELPVLEDDLAIQMAVTNICRQLADDSIDPKRASTLLYGLQVASIAVRRSALNRRSARA
jgi:hypothetical protein